MKPNGLCAAERLRTQSGLVLYTWNYPNRLTDVICYSITASYRSSKPMNKYELQQLLENERFDPKVYSLDDGLPNDRLCLSAEAGRWCVYYSERGSRFDEKCFASEDEASDDLLRRLRELPPPQTRLRSP